MASSKQRSVKSNPETILQLVPSGTERGSKSPSSYRSDQSLSRERLNGNRRSYSHPSSRQSSHSRRSEAHNSHSHSHHSHQDDKTSNHLQDTGWELCVKYHNVVKWLHQRFHRQENVALREDEDEDDQRIFFCLVMSAKCGQLLFILITILVALYSSSAHDFLYRNHNYWVSLPFGCAFIIGTVVRTIPIFQTFRRCFHIILFVFTSICYAYSMGSLSARYNNLIIQKVFLLLTTTAFFLVVFVFLVNISVVKKMLYLSATSSVFFFATTMALLPPVFQSNPSFEVSIDIWIPAFFATEILIFLLIFEMQAVLSGDRIWITKRDWIYLALYL